MANFAICYRLLLWLCLLNVKSVLLNKDPRKEFFRYTVVQPTIYPENGAKENLKIQNEKKLTVNFTAYNKKFILDLWMNTLLLPSHYFEKYQKNGTSILHSSMKESASHCHYQGQIRGLDSSFVAISTCRGLSGVINDGNETYYIEPDLYSYNNSHFLFQAKDLKPQNLACGFSNSSDFLAESHILESLKRSKRYTLAKDPHTRKGRPLYVELIIVNDNRVFRAHNGDGHSVFQRSVEIGNILNGIYAPLNIHIALVGVIIWSEYDEIRISADGDDILTTFLKYRREKLSRNHQNDNAQLITGVTIDGGMIGKALKGPICTHEYSGGISMDHSSIAALVAATIAHELGHNFGMDHDESGCYCPEDKCIMAPAASHRGLHHWSSCSLAYLNIAFMRGMDHCLKNYPVYITAPMCGNGFLEKGEECDCGLKKFCDNRCCDASSCKLLPEATCAMGECCDLNTCQVKAAATVCRDSVSECDFEEYCDGVSEFCPANTFHQNGVECGNGRAYCYDGHCQSHTDQCRLLWGKTGEVSDHECFRQNSRGILNGNCGYEKLTQTFRPCRSEDVLCGMLHCSHRDDKLKIGMDFAARFAYSYIRIKGQVLTCRAVLVDLGLFDTDPSFVPNGAKCGNNMICVNQACIPISSLKIEDCSQKCNGNGVCNNKGNCHCNMGYSPPDCSMGGAGGSIDSGPASDPNYYKMVVILYVIFLCVLPLTLIMVVAIYYRRQLKTWCSRNVLKNETLNEDY